MKKIILAIDGMTCSACSNGLEKYLQKQEGILVANVNLVMANATIEYDDTLVNQKKIEQFVKEAGFKSLGEFCEDNLESKTKSEKVKFLFFSLLAILLMYVSMGHMVGLPTLKIFHMHSSPISYTLILFLLTIPFLIYGFDILKNGYKNLVHKTPNMDTLVSIGVLSSFLYSLYNMYLILRGNYEVVEHLYFEASAIVIFFIKLGRYLDGISKDKTKDAIQKLVKITPNHAILKVNGTEKQVTIDEVKKGDIVISKPGEKIAVDGKITYGKAHLDESFITGESKKASKTIGEKVIAGSINYDGYLEYEAEKIGKESTISEIVRLVIEATNTKAPIAKIADTVSGYFVPIVMLLAFVTFFTYLFLGYDFSYAMTTFVSILVVACPCSLGLATPLAIVISEGVCASHGILVKKSEILENAQKTTTIVFDKTGTLTYGTLKISKILNHSKIEEQQLLQWIGSLESQSTHPIGKAFLDYLQDHNLTPLSVTNFENINGYGIIGEVASQEFRLGNAKMLEKYNIENTHSEEEEKLAKQGNSIVYVTKNKEILALIGVNDMVRSNSKEVISELKKRKIETIMLTGDHEETAKKIAKDIGISTVMANVLPAQKAEIVKNLKHNNQYVMMCGDGINDSPALASSDIGVSFNSGTDIAMDASDVILTQNDLSRILDLICISKKTLQNIKQNLFWAFFYNTLMIPISMGLFHFLGISINPMMASLAMVLSSLTVILNAMRLKK